TWDDSERGEDAIATAVKTRQPLVVRDIAHDPRFASCREEALKRGYVSSVTLPLVVGERVCGTLSVYAGTSDVFDDDEVDLLKEMAGDVAFAIQSIEDEEARTRAEREARESDRRFRALMEGAPVGISISTPDGGVTEVNAAAVRMLGYDSKEDFLKVPAAGHYCEEKDRERFRELLGSGSVRDFEVRLRRKDGTVFWASVASVAQAGKDGAVQLVKSFQDISERKRVEEQLKLFSQAVDGSIDAIVMADLDGKLTYVNRAYADMFGYSREELVGKNISFCHPDQEPELEEAMKATVEGSWTGELTGRRKDGQLLRMAVSSSRVVDGQGNPVARMANVRDVTELKRHESQLRQAQKMEAVGTLAGGIAHDFNNLLVPILGFAELALARMPEGSKAREDVTQVLKAGERAKDLAAQILAFSRQEEGERKPVQLAPIVKEALKLLVAALPSTIEIRQNIGPDTRAVNADPTQIHQILMNLCTNAERAMPDGGVLEVSLENVELDEERAATIEGLRAGSYVRLTVSDTGCGMDEETLKRVFDPFFTTRGPGEGTGMGLSVVHGVVESHEGAITVDSELHRGTTFDVYLLAVESIAEGAPETKERVHGGSESILFVDDEAPIVEMGSETLTRLGYRVTTRTSSVEALELFRFKPGAFDLVITD
ncbi:MAG: PAS domain S-box protein, partial [Chloroflexi bacterium]|nr:PAS domain S-box protein [Chloroflexota bacterium]